MSVLNRLSLRRPRLTRAGLMNRLNSLWVRMVLVVGIVVMLGAIMSSLISLLVIMPDAEALDLEEEFSVEGGPIENLATYYQENGSWDNVERVLAGLQSIYIPTENVSITLAFTDDSDTVRFSGHLSEEEIAEWNWDGTHLEDTLPVVVDGEERGYLNIVARFSSEVYVEFDLGQIFGDWLAKSWWEVALTGAIIGLFFGLLLGRTLTAPLRRLSEAAQAIGARDLSQRVEVRGSTEVRQLATTFNQMATDLEKAETLRRNLVADVAHELRTPLTVLQGNLRAILDDVYPLSKTEVAALYDQTRVLSQLVTDLHELSQAEANKLPLKKRRLDVAQMLENLEAIFTPVAEAQDVSLTLEVTTALPVFGDETRLKQVLTNLVKNALNHTPSGGVITLKAQRDDDNILIDVADTGSGIDGEHLPYIFDRFYRADRSRSRDKGGAGVGLAISKAIIDSHHGQISAKSEGIPGKGTTITVQLPTYNAQMKDARVETGTMPLTTLNTHDSHPVNTD